MNSFVGRMLTPNTNLSKKMKVLNGNKTPKKLTEMTETQLNDFVDYVMSFYGPNGIYPMNANQSLIHSATNDLIEILKIKGEKFCGDSIDRELVRDLLLDKYNLEFVK